MRRRNGKSNKILVFFPFFIGLIFSVSFILAFEHKEQCYSWEQYKLTTRWRTHAWNGSILYLWILLNRAKLKHKTWVNHFGLEVGKTCKFPTSSSSSSSQIVSDNQRGVWTPPLVHPFLSSMATNEVLMTTYFHRFGLIQSFWQCFCKSPPAKLVFYKRSWSQSKLDFQWSAHRKVNFTDWKELSSHTHSLVHIYLHTHTHKTKLDGQHNPFFSLLTKPCFPFTSETKKRVLGSIQVGWGEWWWWWEKACTYRQALST